MKIFTYSLTLALSGSIISEKGGDAMNQPIRISLAAARVNADLTQKEAAKKLKINVSTLQNYETGKTCPNWDMIHRMESLYGIPMDYLNFQKNSL